MICVKCNQNFERDFYRYGQQIWCQTCIDQAKCRHCDSTEEVTVKFPNGSPWAECKACQEKTHREIWQDRDKFYRISRAEDIQLFETLKAQLEEKEQELTTEQEAHQAAIATSQEWHELQKREITEAKDLEIAQWKNKYTQFLNQRKSIIQQEITLLQEILSN